MANQAPLSNGQEPARKVRAAKRKQVVDSDDDVAEASVPKRPKVKGTSISQCL